MNLAQHDSDRKAVLAFDADGLQSGGAQAGFGGHHLQAAARALNILIGASGSDDPPMAEQRYRPQSPCRDARASTPTRDTADCFPCRHR